MNDGRCLPALCYCAYNNHHEVTFDPAKDVFNTAKHGVSLTVACELEWDTALVWPDDRKDYGECRMAGLALRGTRVFCVVFTDRGEERRIISLRKANAREVRRYVAEN